MMLTFHFAAVGDSGESKVPKLKHDVDWAYDEMTKTYSRAKLMQSLGNDLVTIGSDDSTNCIVVGATILQEFHYNMEKIDGVNGKNYNTNANVSELRGAERKLYKGRVAYVRVRVTDMADGNLKCRVSYANPKNVVGSSEQFAHDIAIYVLQICMAVANEYANNGSTVRLIIADHDDCPGLVKEAVEDNERRKLIAKRKCCSHFKGGYCVADHEGNPPEFDCPLFRNGSCMEASV